MSEVSFAVAFLAGLVSFLSPCVLPLIPGFLAYLAGISLTEAGARRREVFLTSVAFVGGFTLVFSVLGVLLNTLLESVAFDVQLWLSRLGGALIIFFGLYLLGLIKLPFLEQEYKLHATRRFESRYLNALAFGAAFAAGWTPCVGAALGSILALAATAPGSAFALLVTYSLGLGVPFLLVGAFAAQAQALIARYATLVRYAQLAFGFILVLLGLLVFTQNLARIAALDLIQRVFGASAGGA
jgi:cytochrome c-type biogenesis protein